MKSLIRIKVKAVQKAREIAVIIGVIAIVYLVLDISFELMK